MTPFFTIVIPTLNEERFIGGILGDLTTQSFTSFEVIHVDGDSEDKTRTIVTSFINRLSIRSLISTRRNLSYQRNLGATSAQGDYLIFVDADTRIQDSRFLQEVYEYCDKSRREIYLPKTKYISGSIISRCMELAYNTAVRIAQSTQRPLPTSGLAIFRRAFFLKIGGYACVENQDIGMLFVEDQEIMNRAYVRGAKSEFLKDVEFVFSLRRIEQEGWLRILTKILISTIELAVGKRILAQSYEMGGQQYRNK